MLTAPGYPKVFPARRFDSQCHTAPQLQREPPTQMDLAAIAEKRRPTNAAHLSI